MRRVLVGNLGETRGGMFVRSNDNAGLFRLFGKPADAGEVGGEKVSIAMFWLDEGFVAVRSIGSQAAKPGSRRRG